MSVRPSGWSSQRRDVEDGTSTVAPSSASARRADCMPGGNLVRSAPWRSVRTMRSGPSDLAANPREAPGIRPMAAAVVSVRKWPSAHRTRRWATRASSSTSPRRSTAPVVRTIDAPLGPARAAALPAGVSITKRPGCSMPWVRHSPSTVLWRRGNSPTRAGRADRDRRTAPAERRLTTMPPPTATTAAATSAGTGPRPTRRTTAATARPTKVAGTKVGLGNRGMVREGLGRFVDGGPRAGRSSG